MSASERAADLRDTCVRLIELVDRLTSGSGPIMGRLSASECHEVTDGVHELVDQRRGAEGWKRSWQTRRVVTTRATASGHRRSSVCLTKSTRATASPTWRRHA